MFRQNEKNQAFASLLLERSNRIFPQSSRSKSRVPCALPSQTHNGDFEYDRKNDSKSLITGLSGEYWTAVGYAKVYPGSLIKPPRYVTENVTIKILRSVALPTSLKHESQLEIMHQRVRLEVELLNELHHPSIAPLVAYRIGDALYDNVIVTPEYKNGTVSAWSKLESPTWEQRIKFVYTLAEGLAFLGAKGIFHADLSPETVLVGDEGQAILIDFGAYIISKENTILDPSELRPVNSTQVPWRWSSMERLQLSEYTPDDDTYSYGCLVLFVLTNVQPYHWVKSAMEFYSRAAGKPPSSPLQLPKGVQLPATSPWWEVMNLCWLEAMSPAKEVVPAQSKSSAKQEFRPSMQTILEKVRKICQ